MKTKQIIKVIPLMFTMTPAFSQTAAERLEQGVQMQSADGNLKGAIAEYEAVLKSAAKSQRLAAEARYRLVECFSSLGNVEQMKVHLEALRSDFPADNKWVVKAASMAPVEWAFEGAPWTDKTLYTYDVRLPDGKVVGSFILGSQLIQKDPAIWETLAVRSAGMRSLSRSVFKEKGYEFQSGRWYLERFGDVTLKNQGGGKITILDSETGEDKGSYEHAKSADSQTPMLENEQAIQILRSLKHDIGTKQKTMICAAHNGGMAIAFDLEVTAHEEIETPAGKFDCAKIESNIKQTFYVSRGENRELVRMDMGAAKIDLAGTETWDRGKKHELESKEFGSKITLPGAMVYCPPNVDDDVYRLQIWSSDFAGTAGLIEINKKSNLLEEAQKGSREYAKVLNEGFAKSADEFEAAPEWDEFEIDGVKAVGLRTTAKHGELTSHSYLIHAVGKDSALTVRLSYAKPDEAKAIARAKEIASGFQW